MPKATLKLYKSFSVDVFDEPYTNDVRFELKEDGKLISKIFDGFVYLQQDLLNEKNVLDVYTITHHLVNNDLSGLVNVCRNEREYDKIGETIAAASALSAYIN